MGEQVDSTGWPRLNHVCSVGLGPSVSGCMRSDMGGADGGRDLLVFGLPGRSATRPPECGHDDGRTRALARPVGETGWRARACGRVGVWAARHGSHGGRGGGALPRWLALHLCLALRVGARHFERPVSAPCRAFVPPPPSPPSPP